MRTLENPLAGHLLPHPARASVFCHPQTRALASIGSCHCLLAFTLVELLVVVAVIGILAALILPVLSRAKHKGQGTYCLNNLRQLQIGWVLYSDEHEQQLAPNSDREQAGKDAAHPSWVAGWLRTDNQAGGKYDSTNVALLVGTNYAAFGSIGQYTREAKLYRCPADKSTVTIEGAVHPRVRSMSMNTYVNGNGKWQLSEFMTFRHMTEIMAPADTWILMDEREDSINDGCFAVAMSANYGIIDYPASYHNGAGALSFADGHAEFHKWLEPTTIPQLKPGEHLPPGIKPTSATDRDIAWLVTHTTQRRN